MPRIALAALCLMGCTEEVFHAYGEDAVLVGFEDGQAMVRAQARVTSMPAANPDGATEAQVVHVGADFSVPITVRIPGRGGRAVQGWDGADVDLPLGQCAPDGPCTQVFEVELTRRRPGAALTGWVTGFAMVTVPHWSPHAGNAPEGALRIQLLSESEVDGPREPPRRGGGEACGSK
ncbi:MAG: hypothetical protein ACI8PZ_004609 [Myxococcota bacterium]|jgi:hypothetical protein